jgi:hypothetical protein
VPLQLSFWINLDNQVSHMSCLSVLAEITITVGFHLLL